MITPPRGTAGGGCPYISLDYIPLDSRGRLSYIFFGQGGRLVTTVVVFNNRFFLGLGSP